MRFICAQPDQPLFIWQLKTLLTSLIKLGISKENIHFLMLQESDAAPSVAAQKLQKYATIHFYQERPGIRLYAASSKPYLFGCFFQQYPALVNEHFLFIESDMILYRIPALPKDDTWYWSDASPYLETGKYERLLGFNPSERAFGFHAYGKGADHHFWYKVEKDAQDLYLKMQTERLEGNIWICEMRSWMWNAAAKFQNEIHPMMIFNDGKGPRKPGATMYHQLSTRSFRKREFSDHPPYDIELSVNPQFCLYDYLAAIKSAGAFFDHNV